MSAAVILSELPSQMQFHSSLYQRFCRFLPEAHTNKHTHAHKHTHTTGTTSSATEKIFHKMILNIMIDSYYGNRNLLLWGRLLSLNASLLWREIPCQPEVTSAPSFPFLWSVYHSPSLHPSHAAFLSLLFNQRKGQIMHGLGRKGFDPLAFQQAPNQKGLCGGWLPFSTSTSAVLCETLGAHVYFSEEYH